MEEHFTTSSGKDGYHKFCGGTVINVKDDRWLYYNAGRGIFGGGYARIYDVEKYGGWSPAIEFNKHLQTGTGHGLSVGEYFRSTYTDPITSAFAMMFFATTGSAILLPSMGSAGTASMSSVSTTVGSLFTKGSGISFAADALSQTTFNVIEGKDPVENYNFVSGVSNTFLKSSFLSAFIGTKFFVSVNETKINSTEEAVSTGLVSGVLGKGADKFTDFTLNKFRINIKSSVTGNINTANPIGVGASTFLHYFSNLNGGLAGKSTNKTNNNNDEVRP